MHQRFIVTKETAFIRLAPQEKAQNGEENCNDNKKQNKETKLTTNENKQLTKKENLINILTAVLTPPTNEPQG